MSSHLNRLLGGENRQQRALIDLQRMTRDDSDVRLLADVLARAHSILRALGLDPRDTTGEEVYRALMAVAPRVEEMACFKASDWVLAEFDGQVISFHPVDIVENYHHQLPFGKHQTTHGKKGLGYEITRRYKNHARTHNATVERVVCDGGICWIERD